MIEKDQLSVDQTVWIWDGYGLPEAGRVVRVTPKGAKVEVHWGEPVVRQFRADQIFESEDAALVMALGQRSSLMAERSADELADRYPVRAHAALIAFVEQKKVDIKLKIEALLREQRHLENMAASARLLPQQEPGWACRDKRDRVRPTWWEQLRPANDKDDTEE